jgi:hypothetical protein
MTPEVINPQGLIRVEHFLSALLADKQVLLYGQTFFTFLTNISPILMSPKSKRYHRHVILIDSLWFH